MHSRREFLKQGSLAAAVLAAIDACTSAPGVSTAPTPASPSPATAAGDASVKDLMLEALDASRRAGASYADVRIGRYRNNFVVTREHQIINVVDTDSLGCGVRALVDGTWGFAATRKLTKDGVAAAAREAAASPLCRRNSRRLCIRRRRSSW